MKLLALIVAYIFSMNSIAYARYSESDDRAVAQVVNGFWQSAKQRDWKAMTKKLHFPFATRGRELKVYVSASQFQNTFVSKKDMSQGMDRYLNTIRISQMKITTSNRPTAYASYTFTWGEKTPRRLTGRLYRNGKTWKISYMMMPH